jgi:hypothetical protein
MYCSKVARISSANGNSSSSLTDLYIPPPTSQWFSKDKNAAGFIANVFFIPSFCISRALLGLGFWFHPAVDTAYHPYK